MGLIETNRPMDSVVIPLVVLVWETYYGQTSFDNLFNRSVVGEYLSNLNEAPAIDLFHLFQFYVTT